VTVGGVDATLETAPLISDLFHRMARGELDISEFDYYRRTGVFPMIHVIAIRRELAAQPGLVQAVYRALRPGRQPQGGRHLPRYHYEQGLSRRRLAPEDIFVPELLGT
jgi:hypothetical protein